MTPEELIAKAQEDLAAANAKIAEQDTKIAELDKKVNPPTVDPDLAYKPETWKSLDEKIDKKAEENTLRILQEAEEKKKKIAEEQEKSLEENKKKIDETFKKLEEAGVIEKTEREDDTGGRQRAQVLGALVSLGGQYLDKAVNLAKSAWDQGMELEYDGKTNEVKLVRAGSSASPHRDAPVGSSANRTPTTPQKGPIDLRGVNGDLEEAERRWELANGKVS